MAPSRSPSPAPPARSATRCCSGSPAASCSAPTSRSSCACSRSRRPSRPPRARRWSSTTARSRCSTAIDINDDPKPRVRRRQRRRCSSAPARAAQGMERGDLLEANGGIFKPQGEAINAGAADDVKVLVVGNPANTNALIAQAQRARRPARALHRDDAPRPQPRDRAARRASSARPVVGRHEHDRSGATTRRRMYPDLFHAKVGGRVAVERGRRRGWSRTTFIPTVAKRGAAIIEARGASSAASAANAAIDHVHDWVLGTPEGDWVSMAVPSDGSYGVAGGHHLLASRAPPRAASTTIVQGLEIDDFSRGGSTPASPSSPRSATPSRTRPDLSSTGLGSCRAPVDCDRRPAPCRSGRV